MKTKLFIVIFVVMLCDAYAQGYYPLEIGNVWQYRDPYDTAYGFTTRAVRDTIMPSGFVYTELQGTGIVWDPNYFRQSGDSVYNYVVYFQAEELWYDFSKSPGDTVATHPQPFGDTSDVILVEIRTVNFFGRILQQWEFFENWRNSSLYAIRVITDSIGMTYLQYEPGETYRLRGAIINGVQYGTITNVEATDGNIVNQYKVYQTYPNPFNASTTISYFLPVASFAVLKVYDLLGREISTLINNFQLPGEHQVSFTANNIPSGVYYYQLNVNSQFEIPQGSILTKKFIYLK